MRLEAKRSVRWAGVAAICLEAILVEVPASTQECPSTPGLSELLKPGTVLLLGEMHGTLESPRFVEQVVCSALAAKLRVTVALEISGEENNRVATFMSSSGTAADRRAGPGVAVLGRRLSGRAAESGDGRHARSAAGEADVDSRLQVAPIDGAPSTRGQARDHEMAARIAAIADEASDAMMAVLTGNYHTRTVGDGTFEPMGAAFRRLRPSAKVVALDVAYDGGSAWFCTSAAASTCGIRTVKERANPLPKGISLFGENRGGFDGRYNVGTLTASPPAMLATPRAASP